MHVSPLPQAAIQVPTLSCLESEQTDTISYVSGTRWNSLRMIVLLDRLWPHTLSMSKIYGAINYFARTSTIEIDGEVCIVCVGTGVIW